MSKLTLHDFHAETGAHFEMLNGEEVVANYGDPLTEHAALLHTAGILDLSFRGRICLAGADRLRFLHGQVTNDIKELPVGGGCYSALTTAKGRMQSDLNIYRLEDELLLDFEPGLTQIVSERLERFIVADDVQVVNVAPLYGLLSVQGPSAAEIVSRLSLFETLPAKAFSVSKGSNAKLGELYLMNLPRLGTDGFDLFMPIGSLGSVACLLADTAGQTVRLCGWEAFELARIEKGIPRFGIDMDESNFPQECGIESRAVSYAKGCYIGQEVLNRIHTLGHVNKELAGLRLADGLKRLPIKGDKLFHAGKEVGYITSAVASPALKAKIALAYLRNEANKVNHDLTLRTAEEESAARIVKTPFSP